ncbi:uncharacterized protein F5891DRAFT_1186135 [Suillus fuscotomentosus]|uniref:Uncharacterized protein n=1 Tax=Suillus fuscotomentosus TaxID=1912939 RepID=A0AAD4EAC5_9AGAM|nr:uncharacterized protein F5891DRAFT_1186135 [Suillus fuscotomentosus]KAG1902510.1 hypothetical protein F5891DRAFT_1186135 [Suillus fuscotomentosus]
MSVTVRGSIDGGLADYKSMAQRTYERDGGSIIGPRANRISDRSGDANSSLMKGISDGPANVNGSSNGVSPADDMPYSAKAQIGYRKCLADPSLGRHQNPGSAYQVTHFGPTHLYGPHTSAQPPVSVISALWAHPLPPTHGPTLDGPVTWAESQPLAVRLSRKMLLNGLSGCAPDRLCQHRCSPSRTHQPAAIDVNLFPIFRPQSNGPPSGDNLHLPPSVPAPASRSLPGPF